jgi:hypothetical protein
LGGQGINQECEEENIFIANLELTYRNDEDWATKQEEIKIKQRGQQQHNICFPVRLCSMPTKNVILLCIFLPVLLWLGSTAAVRNIIAVECGDYS